MLPVEIITANGRFGLEGEVGEKLSAAIWLSGHIPPQPLCNGLGLCGRCKARYLSAPPEACEAERRYFSAQDLQSGWRLACRHNVEGNEPIRLEIPRARKIPQKLASLPAQAPLFVGIDLGTTSIEWRALGSCGEAAAEGQLWNPQGGAGADIISRLQMAQSPQGRARLSAVACDAISQIATVLKQSGSEARSICVAANSAMTEILLDMDVSGLCHAPYSLSFKGGLSRPLPGMSRDMPAIIFPPLPGPFIGGDISAGILAILESGPRLPFLLLDLGTNCELALLDSEHRLFLGSVPLGPALEGIGPECGQPATQGITTAYHLSPHGLYGIRLGGDKGMAGISASGYLSLLAILFRLQILSAAGGFQQGSLPLARKITAGLAPGRLNLPDDLYISSQDVEMLLKVKAALAVALRYLMNMAQVEAGAIEAVFLAGALGQHVNSDDLITLGLLPRIFAGKCVIAGNTSLAGACMLALAPEKMRMLERLCAHAKILNLADNSCFLNDYLDEMRWGD